jgi:acetyltransferase-like isoleucine patch superfamily enzyme
MIEGCHLCDDVIIRHPDLCNLYGCWIGARTLVGPFVEIQKGVVVGEDCKIESHSFLCTGVLVGNRVFIGHGVMTTNDLRPIIGTVHNERQTRIGDDVSIGSGAVLLPVEIGQGAVIGAGAVVTRDVRPWTVVAGNPARVLHRMGSPKEREKWIDQARNRLRAFP